MPKLLDWIKEDLGSVGKLFARTPVPNPAVLVKEKDSTIRRTPPTITNRYETLYLNMSRPDRVNACAAMYENDPRIVESINSLSRDIAKAGFEVDIINGPKKAQKIADQLIKDCRINSQLYSWVRKTMIEGESFLEIAVDSTKAISGIKRHQTLNMHVLVDDSFVVTDPAKMYWYAPYIYDQTPTDQSLRYADWQIIHLKWIPDRLDLYGMPLFAASQSFYQRSHDGEDDLYVRRRTRAGIKYIHSIEDGSQSDIDNYKEVNKEALADPMAAQIDFFANKKTTIAKVEGDAHIGEMQDVLHNIETMLIASPVPSGLNGNVSNTNRETLILQKEQYDIAIDFLTEQWLGQGLIRPLLERAWLLAGIDPDQVEYQLSWRYRVVLTPDQMSQIADAALKLRAAGWSEELLAKIMVRYIPGTTLKEFRANISPVVTTQVNQGDLNKSGTSNGTNLPNPPPPQPPISVNNTKGAPQRNPRVASTNASGANLEKK